MALHVKKIATDNHVCMFLSSSYNHVVCLIRILYNSSARHDSTSIITSNTFKAPTNRYQTITIDTTNQSIINPITKTNNNSNGLPHINKPTRPHHRPLPRPTALTLLPRRTPDDFTTTTPPLQHLHRKPTPPMQSHTKPHTNPFSNPIAHTSSHAHLAYQANR
jgi:hypothetical protein